VVSGFPRAITSGHATDTLPCFTPDGQKIVFTSTRGTDLYHHSNVLYEVPVAGGEPKTLGVLQYAQIQPTVTRDGQWMAFTALDEMQNANFYACVAPFGDPGFRFRLTSPNESCYGAAISPDGRAVAYTSPGPDRERGWDIWIRAVFSDAVYRVTNSAANDRSPSWSPDGQRLVFESNREGTYHLYVVDVSSLPVCSQARSEAKCRRGGGRHSRG
jgi:Tol biopolymer transport system component